MELNSHMITTSLYYQTLSHQDLVLDVLFISKQFILVCIKLLLIPFALLAIQNCSFGYFVGGWGKPPVDSIGRPLYGDVFGLDNPGAKKKVQPEQEVDKSLWGELESEEESEEESDVSSIMVIINFNFST